MKHMVIGQKGTDYPIDLFAQTDHIQAIQMVIRGSWGQETNHSSSTLDKNDSHDSPTDMTGMGLPSELSAK